MEIGIFIAIFAVTGGFAIAFYALWLDGKKRRLRHIERMAMIEKGLVPSSEADSIVAGQPFGRGEFRRQRSSGVFMICIGIALGFMFYQQHQGFQSVWIGALIALIGVANLVNALFDERDAVRQRSPKAQP
jgi:putative copper export protein